jgi:hypothetical protein
MRAKPKPVRIWLKTARIWDGAIPGTHEPDFIERPITQLELSPELRAAVHGPHKLQLYRFTMGECNILLGHEPVLGDELRWHLTISCPDRHPTWDEIKVAKYRLTGPDVVMAMIFPPVESYVNVEAQDHVFQLWEVVDECRPWL